MLEAVPHTHRIHVLHVSKHRPWVSFFTYKIEKIKPVFWTSLMAQCLRIRLSMQGTQVRALVQEDPTCHGAAKPVRHNYWACALEAASHNYWSPCATTTEACAPRACALQREATTVRSPCITMKSSSCSLQLEKAHAQQWRPKAAKN